MIVAWIFPFVLAIAILLIVAFVLCLVLPLVRLYGRAFAVFRHRRVLLRPSSEWWPEFECQLRSYIDGSLRR
jgi:hypothetical protein